MRIAEYSGISEKPTIIILSLSEYYKSMVIGGHRHATILSRHRETVAKNNCSRHANLPEHFCTFDHLNLRNDTIYFLTKLHLQFSSFILNLICLSHVLPFFLQLRTLMRIYKEIVGAAQRKLHNVLVSDQFW